MKFTIPKEFHISHVLPGFYKNKSYLNFDFTFTSNCIYDLGLIHNQDCNKLYGLSFGLIHNTTTLWGRLFKKKANSFRLGWNCEMQDRKIQLFAYYYNNGKRSIEFIADVDLNRKYNCNMVFDRLTNKIVIDINSTDALIQTFASQTDYDFNFSSCPKYGLYLYPYFGGVLSAPHKMTIYIN